MNKENLGNIFNNRSSSGSRNANVNTKTNVIAPECKERKYRGRKKSEDQFDNLLLSPKSMMARYILFGEHGDNGGRDLRGREVLAATGTCIGTSALEIPDFDDIGSANVIVGGGLTSGDPLARRVGKAKLVDAYNLAALDKAKHIVFVAVPESIMREGHPSRAPAKKPNGGLMADICKRQSSYFPSTKSIATKNSRI